MFICVMEVYMELKIGEQIAKYRKSKGYTQEQLGALVGVSGQAVSKWENGGVPDAYLFPVLSDVLNVSIDALFGVEKKVAEYTKDQMMDTLYDFCLQKNASKENAFHFFDFLFNTVWTLQSAYFGGTVRQDFQDALDKNSEKHQIASQIINNEGTTFLSLVKDFPFFCAVWDAPEISKRILSEPNFTEFFSLLASKDGLKAILFTQTAIEPGQYTADVLAKKMGISLESFLDLEPLLIKYGILDDDEIILNDRTVKTYREWNNSEIRPLLLMAYQIMNTKQCYYYYTCHRNKPYLTKE